MKSLVIAEKPSVARDIARVLKCGKQINGAMEGSSYVVTWGLGHLVTLADPEDYDKKYKEWKMEDLPMMPKPFKLEVIRQTAKQYGISKSTVHKDVTERLLQINPSLASAARGVLDTNKSERHIRGGLATKEKYLHQH